MVPARTRTRRRETGHGAVRVQRHDQVRTVRPVERSPRTIVHLSDIHLDAAKQKPGVDPVGNLAALLERVDEIDPACIVITGDVLGEPDRDLYLEARDMLGPRNVVWCPGNHDDAQLMRDVFTTVADTEVGLGAVRVIAVDSTVPGRTGGSIDHIRLQWLDAALAESETPAFIALHHPPSVFAGHALGSILLDEVSSAHLERVLRRHAHRVAAVLCGHLHQCMAAQWAGTSVIVAPSSAYTMRRTHDGMQWAGSLGEMLVHRFDGPGVSSRVERTGAWQDTEETARMRMRGDESDSSPRSGLAC